jgi:hypothetical protein
MRREKPKHHERSLARGMGTSVLVLGPLDLQHGRACLALALVTHLATDPALSAQVLAQATQAQQALQGIVAVLGHACTLATTSVEEVSHQGL